MDYNLLMGPQPGDLYWWDNPLKKEDPIALDSHHICGTRPAMIITLTNYNFTFVPCTSSKRTYGQVYLKSKVHPKHDYRLTHPILMEPDDNRFQKYIGHISETSLDLVKSLLASSVSNPYIKTTEIEYNLNPIPVGKLVELNNQKFVIVNGNSTFYQKIPVIEVDYMEDAKEYDYFLLDYRNRRRYRLHFNWSTSTKYEGETFRIIGSISAASRAVFQWKVEAYLRNKIRGLEFKLKELEQLLDVNGIAFPENYNRISEVIALVEDPPVKIEYPFADWFKPEVKSNFLKDVTSFEELKEKMAQLDGSYVSKTVSYYYRNMVRAAIDFDKAPQEVIDWASELIREYNKKAQ